MHYYQFNIKDYSFASIRMSLMEDLAFRRMLDFYYETEKPLPCELKRIAKLIGMSDHQESIRDVLNEFWLETESGWVNTRAELEIVKYHSKAESARLNGKKGGRPKTQQEPRITQSVNLANPDITQPKANHKPITNNHKPLIDICQLVTDEYNFKLSELGKVKILSDKRKAHIKASIKQFKNSEHDFAKIETWTRLFDYITESDFLMGRVKNSDWIANFDFIINKSNLLKIVEGQYDNK